MRNMQITPFFLSILLYSTKFGMLWLNFISKSLDERIFVKALWHVGKIAYFILFFNLIVWERRIWILVVSIGNTRGYKLSYKTLSIRKIALGISKQKKKNLSWWTSNYTIHKLSTSTWYFIISYNIGFY